MFENPPDFLRKNKFISVCGIFTYSIRIYDLPESWDLTLVTKSQLPAGNSPWSRQLPTACKALRPCPQQPQKTQSDVDQREAVKQNWIANLWTNFWISSCSKSTSYKNDISVAYHIRSMKYIEHMITVCCIIHGMSDTCYIYTIYMICMTQMIWRHDDMLISRLVETTRPFWHVSSS